MELQYKWLRILSQYYFYQDPEFRSTMETSSVGNELLLWLSWNRFLCNQCPNISFISFKDNADLRMKSFSCKQSLHTLSPGANGFSFLKTSHLMLKLFLNRSDVLFVELCSFHSICFLNLTF